MEITPGQLKVLTRSTLEAIGITQSNPTLLRWEHAGKFPKRYYLSERCPAWNAEEIFAWLAAKQAVTEPNRVAEKATTANRRRRANADLAVIGSE